MEGGLEEARQLFGRLLFNGEVPEKIYYSALIWFLVFATLRVCFVDAPADTSHWDELRTSYIFLFRSARDITVAFPPIWSLLFPQTHTLHVLAKYHTLHDTEALPVLEPEIPQRSLYTTSLSAYCVYADMHKDKTIRKSGCRHSLACIFCRMNWRCGTFCLPVLSRTPAIVCECVHVRSAGMNN